MSCAYPHPMPPTPPRVLTLRLEESQRLVYEFRQRSAGYTVDEYHRLHSGLNRFFVRQPDVECYDVSPPKAPARIIVAMVPDFALDMGWAHYVSEWAAHVVGDRPVITIYHNYDYIAGMLVPMYPVEPGKRDLEVVV
ncbi:hypothetical protein Q8F55_006199 [Vanrija albida]|uniref:Uncharacterized protein n=1 Tax=Vanrija albida TaxID=181172 RepID=A0ABR3PWF4_9TREE